MSAKPRAASERLQRPSLLCSEFVRVLSAPGLRLQRLRHRRLGDDAGLSQQPADRLRRLRPHRQPVPAHIIRRSGGRQHCDQPRERALTLFLN